MKEEYTAFYQSPVGYFKIVGAENSIRQVHFTELKSAPESAVPACLKNCFQQFDEYFAGSRENFDLPLEPEGTEFQQSVWQELLKIPYGKTVTYLDIANQLNNPKAIRAVGAANGRNPIPVIIQCHRVIGSNGQLIGFGGGIWRKEFLLRHENALLI